MARKKGKRPVAASQPGRKKQPRTEHHPSGRKMPAQSVTFPDDVYQRQLVWRFGLVDHEGPWCIHGRCDADQLRNLLEKLASFESMTLAEAFQGGYPAKAYDTESLPSEPKRRLIDLEYDDETRVSRFRLGGAERLYGIMREHVFYVLWWDPEHEVWPTNPN